ncbi:fibronectin type III domain-containing protein 4-like protein [Lates japonicus]|uniref:Fibronectin type III domain-containing protein 4-like protein n=1 Tax=Lates japonicus TaxID=270547 RepID=A0AAD3NHU2_LATJO|nr:fibronectin type III domain-containing protein 4-like protein [Lates japonicus]
MSPFCTERRGLSLIVSEIKKHRQKCKKRKRVRATEREREINEETRLLSPPRNQRVHRQPNHDRWLQSDGAKKHRPPAPVNVSVMHLRADSATVSWEVPEGDIIIGFSISQQRQDGHMQRFIREVNTTSRSCVLWDLEEETDYIIQVQSIGLYGESQASKKVHFRTLKKTDRFPSNSSNQDDPTVQGLDKSRHLQTGEMIIIVVVLVMWAAVIALFCRQYDIIKDNDSSNNKEKAKPSSERSTPEHHSGGLLRSKFHPSVPSINIIEV